MPEEKRAPSNRMHIADESGILGRVILWTILLILTSAFVLVMIATRGLYLVVVAVVILILLCRDRRVSKIQRDRTGESICTFARSFNCRETDTWIVRAVFEELSVVGYPVRRDDRFEDLGFVGDDLDELVETIASRAGRSLDSAGVVHLGTVSDLFEFLMRRPRQPIV